MVHTVLFVGDYFTPGACDLTFEKLKSFSLMTFTFQAISQTLRQIDSFTSTRKWKSPANTTVWTNEISIMKLLTSYSCASFTVKNGHSTFLFKLWGNKFLKIKKHLHEAYADHASQYILSIKLSSHYDAFMSKKEGKWAMQSS